MDLHTLQAQVDKLGFGIVARLNRLNQARLEALLHLEGAPAVPVATPADPVACPGAEQDDDGHLPFVPCKAQPITPQERDTVQRVLDGCSWPVSVSFVAHRAQLMPSRTQVVLHELVAAGQAAEADRQFRSCP